LTLFNRGKTNPGKFTEIEQLHGDRDPKKGEGLKALEGTRQWDVVFDDCGYYPRMVKASAELLDKRVAQYVYISSISCYAKTDAPNADESAELATMADPTLETMGSNYEYYGALKALCERATQAVFPSTSTIVRPGYIVGPGDFSDRFTYWPVRVARGGEMAVPGAASDPIQIIDVRDLGEWLVRVGEARTFGVFNACGPEKKLSMGEMLEACKQVSKADTSFVWMSADFVEKHPTNFPIWAPPTGETAGVHTSSNARAIKAGLTFRPIATIAKDTLEWYRALPDDRRAKSEDPKNPGHWLLADDEKKLIEDWRATQKG
jgi:2'-hydroxyisoflavone reductase